MRAEYRINRVQHTARNKAEYSNHKWTLIPVGICCFTSIKDIKLGYKQKNPSILYPSPSKKGSKKVAKVENFKAVRVWGPHGKMKTAVTRAISHINHQGFRITDGWDDGAKRICLIYFFDRERAVSWESWNLIGSGSGQYFPISWPRSW